jgi:addiction module RelB/DinJ family antitoxin
MTATLTVRMDAGLKAKFNSILATLGLDAPTAVRMLAKQTVENKALPLSLNAKTCLPFENEKAVLDWSEEMNSEWWDNDR